MICKKKKKKKQAPLWRNEVWTSVSCYDSSRDRALERVDEKVSNTVIMRLQYKTQISAPDLSCFIICRGTWLWGENSPKWLKQPRNEVWFSNWHILHR